MTHTKKAAHEARQRRLANMMCNETPEQYTNEELERPDRDWLEWPTLPAIAYFDDGELRDIEVFLGQADADAAHTAFWRKLGLGSEDAVERYRMDGGKEIAVSTRACLIGHQECADSGLLVLPDDLYWSLFDSDSAVVMSESALEEFAERLGVSLDEARRMAETAAADYDFGGEPDRSVDLVDSTEHLFFKRVQGIAT